MSDHLKGLLEADPSILGALSDLERLHGLSLSLLAADGRPLWGAQGAEGGLRLPLAGPGGEPLGWLSLWPAPEGPQAERLRSLASHLASWLRRLLAGEAEMDSLAGELAARYEEINLMFRVGRHLKMLGGGERALRDILAESVAALECDLIVFCLSAEGLIEQAGPLEVDPAQMAPEGLIACLESAQESGEFLVNLGPGGPAHGLGVEAGSAIIFPVDVEEKRQGLLACFSRRRGVFTNSKVNLMQALSAQISIVLTNNKLIQTMKDFLLEVVTTLVSTIEAKDEYTRGHSERVQEISLAIGAAMGLEPALMEDLRWAAILHDIGKIGIPDTILRKPGRLTEEEFAEIKKHPQRGLNILKSLASLSAILPAILHHHERFDGRGYPAGLAGEQIPLLARLIAVGDTFDAITSTRAYRTARSSAEALAEIERVAGSQLDPQIVEVFAALCRREGPGAPLPLPLGAAAAAAPWPPAEAGP